MASCTETVDYFETPGMSPHTILSSIKNNGGAGELDGAEYAFLGDTHYVKYPHYESYTVSNKAQSAPDYLFGVRFIKGSPKIVSFKTVPSTFDMGNISLFSLHTMSSAEQKQEGIRLFEEGQKAEAVKLFRKAAERGDAQAIEALRKIEGTSSSSK